MRITARQLRQIIKEELLREVDNPGSGIEAARAQGTRFGASRVDTSGDLSKITQMLSKTYEWFKYTVFPAMEAGPDPKSGAWPIKAPEELVFFLNFDPKSGTREPVDVTDSLRLLPPEAQMKFAQLVRTTEGRVLLEEPWLGMIHRGATFNGPEDKMEIMIIPYLDDQRGRFGGSTFLSYSVALDPVALDLTDIYEQLEHTVDKFGLDGVGMESF